MSMDKPTLNLRDIAHRARRDKRADIRFREYMKHRLPLSNAELDRQVHSITAQVWAQIDCRTCAQCCRKPQVVLDDEDIRRLSRAVKLNPREFRRQFTVKAEDGAVCFAQRPCPFLAVDGACSVYAQRPTSCRDYPYIQLPHVRSRSITMLECVGECPIVFSVWQELKRRHLPNAAEGRPSGRTQPRL
jgi:Fe-S-cluster containining protein